MQTTKYQIEGKVFEVLHGCGLASVSSKQGSIYTVDRHAPGIDFDNLHKDQLIRCMVDLDSKRVVRADLI
jgi:hypothetical protein